jgi:hypothetical protein
MSNNTMRVPLWRSSQLVASKCSCW